MNNLVNVAIQVLPISSQTNKLSIIDRAIEIIQHSGLTYKVCPFETVIEGKYEHIMEIIQKIQEICLTSGADELITNIKIHVRNNKDVRISEKMEKY